MEDKFKYKGYTYTRAAANKGCSFCVMPKDSDGDPLCPFYGNDGEPCWVHFSSKSSLKQTLEKL